MSSSSRPVQLNLGGAATVWTDILERGGDAELRSVRRGEKERWR